jgi:hypothetical protein
VQSGDIGNVIIAELPVGTTSKYCAGAQNRESKISFMNYNVFPVTEIAKAKCLLQIPTSSSRKRGPMLSGAAW